MKPIKIIKHDSQESEPTMWVVNWNAERHYLIVSTVPHSIEYNHDCFFHLDRCPSYPVAYAPNEAGAMRIAKVLLDAKESLKDLPAPYGEEFEILEHTRELTRKAINVWEPPSRLVY